jgi:plastocyanin
MLDSFDSRALRLTDCYGQRFMKAGTFRYHALPVGTDCIVDERPFVVTVVEAKGKDGMKQHDVTVRAEGATFRADPPELQIEAGDLVLWHCPDAKALPYMIVGDKEFFASTRLINESGFTHAFSAAGEYRWRDAYGSDVGGVIRVRDPGCRNHNEMRKWREALGSAALVMISGDTAQPAEVEIFTGQTVFFAVTKSKGVSVTDERLLGKAAR